MFSFLWAVHYQMEHVKKHISIPYVFKLDGIRVPHAHLYNLLFPFFASCSPNYILLTFIQSNG